jgi:proteasome-associated ATPase
MEKAKLPQCERVVEAGGAPPDNCNCPACTFDRAMAAMRAAQARAATTPKPIAPVEILADPKTEAPAIVKAAPKKGAAKVRAEESARGPVQQYLVGDIGATTWEDVIGNEEALGVLQRAIEAPVKHADLYEFYGLTAPKGVLLEGAPGCGKTMIARAAAAAMSRVRGTDRPGLLRINGPEIQTPYIGQTEKIIREIFAYARAFHARYGYPLIVFIDEADSLLPPRDGMGGRPAQSWEASQVAAFLTEMDGLESGGAMVILATNRAHAIDAAILRPGRVDVKVRVERPGQEACTTILYNVLRKVPIHAQQQLKGHEPVQFATRGDYPAAEEARKALAERAVQFLFSSAHVIHTLQSDVGPLHLTMKHIVSGALVTELGNRAKAFAFERDLAAGTRCGVMDADATAAVHALVVESARSSHPDALHALCLAAGARIAASGALPDEDGEPGEEMDLRAVRGPRKDTKLN